MDNIKVLLADGSSQLTDKISRYMARSGYIEAVASVSDGSEVLQAVKEHLPDVVVMELILSRCDGFMVLSQLARLPDEARPRVIILTSLARDDMIIRAMELGAAYFMAKPFDIQLLCERIQETAALSRQISESPPPRPEATCCIDEQLTALFLTLGIPAHIKGYSYLRTAVNLAIRDRSITSRMTRELYPAVAKAFSATPSKVERAMRHAIEVAWNRGRLDSANRLLGQKLFERLDKPTNGEFISCIAEMLARSA